MTKIQTKPPGAHDHAGRGSTEEIVGPHNIKIGRFVQMARAEDLVRYAEESPEQMLEVASEWLRRMEKRAAAGRSLSIKL